MSLRIQRCGLVANSGRFVLPEGVFYNLGALPVEVSSVLVWPTAPTTTTETTVTDLAGLQAAIDINGARVIVDGTITGTAVIRGDDVELVGLPGSSVGRINIERDTHRVRVADLVAESVNLNPPLVFQEGVGSVPTEAVIITDVIVDNVTINNPTENGINCFGRRVAILNCNVTANWYSVWVGAFGEFFFEDIIIAGCNMDSAGTEATIRILQTQRSVVVENTLTNGSKHNWRLHQGADIAYCARNTLVNGGIMLTDPAEPTDVNLGRFWFENNEVIYTLANGVIITIDPYTRITQGTIANNTFTMSGATVFEDIWSYGAVPGDWDLSGNVIVNP